MAEKPNIVWIIPDDTNYKMLNFGGGVSLSPNLDSIARDGVVMKEYHCSSPACGPSRYSYFTGHYGGRCPADSLFRDTGPNEPYKIFFNAHLDPERELSIGNALQQAGYRTGHVGKWHIGSNPADGAAFPRFDPDDDPRAPEVNAKMKSHQEAVCNMVRKAGFDYAASVILGNHEMLPKKAKNHNIEWITKGALNFIDKYAKAGEPFFLSMATTTIHGPNHVSSLLADPHLTAGGYSDDHIGCQASRQSIYDRISKAPGVKFNSTTAGVLWMDDAVGAVLEKLRALGLEENTLVIFSGDHGPSIGGKFSLYQRGTCIPFFARWPGRIPAGRVASALAQNIDFIPTLLDVAGAEAPEGMVLDGTSMLPVLSGKSEETEGREDLYFEFGYTRAVRTSRWKYIAWRMPRGMMEKFESGELDELRTHYDNTKRPLSDLLHASLVTATLLAYPHYFEPDQLYDLENDPYEQHNLVADEKYADVLKDMRARLRKYLDSFSRPFDLDNKCEFFFSDRFKELKGKVDKQLVDERGPWVEDMEYVGFAGAAVAHPAID